MVNYEWMKQASCRDEQGDLFFPHGSQTSKIEKAKEICRGCPVRLDCLKWALMTEATGGIFGGATDSERLMMVTIKPDLMPSKSISFYPSSDIDVQSPLPGPKESLGENIGYMPILRGHHLSSKSQSPLD